MQMNHPTLINPKSIRIEVIGAQPSHIPKLLSDMRAQDQKECLAAGKTPQEALTEALQLSEKAWAGLADGELVCLFGVAQSSWDETIGIPWLLGTNRLPELSISFLRRNRRYLREMSKNYARLMNYVDADNQHSIEWLQWLGFTIHEPEAYGPYRHPFRLFTMEVKSCVLSQ